MKTQNMKSKNHSSRLKFIFHFISLFFLMNFLSSCGSADVKTDEAKKIVEGLLTDLKNENYDRVDDYFTSSFNQSENMEAKVQKFIRLLDTTGPIQSFEFVSEEKKYDDTSGYNQLSLIYKVKCSRTTLKETFIVVSDEGKLGIIFYNLENLEE
ncbi:MAG: hypothetical protein IPK10_07495 [Bacteroidetes bacterium]|nr:hypothetical protein [Bacteroidota bacterium]